MTSSRNDELAAGVERRDEGDAGNTATAPLAEAVFVDPDDEGGAVVLLRDARGDDADDAGMPAARTDDDGVAALRRRQTLDDAFGLLAGREFEFLSLAVLTVEGLGEETGLGGILTEQQIERGHGGVEPTRGIESRPELEADVVSADRTRDPGDGLEGDEAGMDRALKLSETAAGEEPVFRLERDDVDLLQPHPV